MSCVRSHAGKRCWLYCLFIHLIIMAKLVLTVVLYRSGQIRQGLLARELSLGHLALSSEVGVVGGVGGVCGARK